MRSYEGLAKELELRQAILEGAVEFLGEDPGAEFWRMGVHRLRHQRGDVRQ